MTIRSAKPFLRVVRPPRAIADVLATLPNAPRWVPELLRALDRDAPGRVEHHVAVLGLARAGALDIGDLIGMLIDHLRGCTHLDLIRLSLTVPHGADRDLASVMHTFAQDIANEDNTHGALLALDRRPRDLSAHVHGGALATRGSRPRLALEWCRRTGASSRGVDIRTISRWRDFSTNGDESLFQPHLSRVINYTLQPLPQGLVRDVDTEVAVYGSLRPPWSVFRERGGLRPPEAEERLRPIRVAVPRTCQLCGGPIPIHKKVGTKFCKTAHRMANRNRSRNPPDDRGA